MTKITLAAALGLLLGAVGTASAADVQDPVSELPGFEPDELPQFVAVTFDDNFSADGMGWAQGYFSPLHNPAGQGVDRNYDGTPARTTFFHNSTYLDWDGIPEAWSAAYGDGHELANHTENHPNGRQLSYDVSAWNAEVAACTSQLSAALGVAVSAVRGFRSPYLGYNDATFAVLRAQGLEYDSSIGTCWDSSEDGTNCRFPYTLDRGSPDNLVLAGKFAEPTVLSHAGLWEVPISALLLPPDEVALQYGITPGLRGRILPADMITPSYYEPESGKIAGLDISLFADAGMNAAEVLGTLKYNFDLRLAGNRAPLVFVAHTHVYSSSYDSNAPGTAAERRSAIEGFLSYALSHEATRVRPLSDVVEWMRRPLSLTGQAARPIAATGGAPGAGGSPATGGQEQGAWGGLGGAGGDDEASLEPGCSCRAAPGGRHGPAVPSALGLALGGALLARRLLARRRQGSSLSTR